MQTLAIAGAGVVLLLTVGVGIVAHELSHAAVLFLFGIRCDVAIGPARDGVRQLGATIPGGWATVTPREISPGTSAWALRVSSVAPLVLAVPFVTVLTGVVPDPVQSGNPLLVGSTVGWLACAIPSPQDFSVFWHAEQALAQHGAGPLDG
jgi:hypothetical protein